MTSETSVNLTADLHRRVQARALASGYLSVDEYVAHLLQRELAGDGDSKSLDERLKGLGYL